MSFDQNDSVESTLDEILAELDLLPSPSAARETSVSETPVSEVPVSQAPVSEISASSEAAAPQPEKEPEAPKPEVQPLTVSVTTEQARPAAEPLSAAEEPEEEEDSNEPSTMVFSPSRLREQIRAAALASEASQKIKVSPPSSASLKAELEQRSRLGAGHTVTEQLRAQDPVRFDTMPKRRYQAAKKADPVTVERPEPKQPKPARRRLRPGGPAAKILDGIKSLAIVAVVVVLLCVVVFRFVNVWGDSMQPTLQEGDRLIISCLFYQPDNGDIVITNDDNNLGKPLIKRVIARGGQTVDLDEDGNILVNGLVLDEDYTGNTETDMSELTLPLTVPEGHVFLAGDNRPVSVDSRSPMLGCIPEDEIVGGVMLRYWPLNRIGGVK